MSYKYCVLKILFFLTLGLLASCAKSSEPNVIAANRAQTDDEKPMENTNEKDHIGLVDLSKIPTVTYCELIKNADAYDHKNVRVRAIYLNEFEKTYLFDERCQIAQTPTAPKEVPAETWAEWDKSFDTKSDSEEAVLNRKLKGFGRKDVTVIGRFYSTEESGDANAPNRFGHLNCCRYKFSIMRVEAIAGVENKSAENVSEYGKIVKYNSDKKVEFPDFTLAVNEKLVINVAIPQPNQKLPTYGFYASRGNESIMIYGNSEPDDNTPLDFKFGGARYQIESGISDKSGRLAKDELIVRRMN